MPVKAVCFSSVCRKNFGGGWCVSMAQIDVVLRFIELTVLSRFLGGIKPTGRPFNYVYTSLHQRNVSGCSAFRMCSYFCCQGSYKFKFVMMSFKQRSYNPSEASAESGSFINVLCPDVFRE